MRDHIDRHRPGGLSVKRGCELTNLARSTLYSPPMGQQPKDAAEHGGEAQFGDAVE